MPRLGIPFNKNEVINNSSSIKFLGLTIDETLSWKEHIMKLKQKIVRPVGILKRLNDFVPKNVIRSIYFALIHSHLQYLTLIWHSTSKNNLKILQILQNKAIKNIYSLNNLYSTERL